MSLPDEPPYPDDATPPRPGEGWSAPAAEPYTAEAPGADAVPGILSRLESVEQLAVDLASELADYPAGGPWFWRELAPQQRAELWAELDDFVVWLQNRILTHVSDSSASIPPCWYRHPDAVEMLTALMVAHSAAYRPKTHKPSFVLVDWFQRALWPTLETFKARNTFKNCRDNNAHRESFGGILLEAGSAEFEEFLREEFKGNRGDA